MNLENSVKDVIANKLADGTIEKLIEEQLEKGVTKALDNLFGSYGDVTKVIQEKIKSVMVPYLENYDYSQYITKLDDVLLEVLKNSTSENKKLLENFKELMTSEILPEELKLKDIYKKWCKYCEKTIDKDNIENYDYEGGYINVSLNVENVSSDWSDWEKYVVRFECEEDEDLNIEFYIERWKKFNEKFNLEWRKSSDLKSLRHLNEFDMYMMKVNQAYLKIELDTESESDEIFIEYEE